MKFKCLFLSLTIFFCFLDFGFAQQLRQPIVRLIYFLPNDLQPQQNIDGEIDRLIKDVQQFYANEMDRHGFGRKTFMFETDAAGQAVVHHVNGQFAGAYYHQQTWDKVWREISQQFDTSKNIYLAVIDIRSENFGSASGHGVTCGEGGIYGTEGGRIIIPASGNCFVGEFGFIVAAHELGHAFGLFHDFRNDTYLMSYGRYRSELSQCAAEWLDVHPYLNKPRIIRNLPVDIQPLPPLAAPPHSIRFRFKVTDPDGLHQAQLHTPATGVHEAPGKPKLLDCKRVSGERKTVEFVTSQLTTKSEAEVIFQIIDRRGNLATRVFIIDISSVLPAPKVVSVPDVNLAEALRQNLGLAAGKPITQLDLFRLNELFAADYPVTDLTGIEHAKNLRVLYLHGSQIGDLTPLAELTNLQHLLLEECQVNNITPLSNLTNLTVLSLAHNQVRDITPLIGLTNLTWLGIGYNQIRDITPLAGFTNLHHLHLWGNQVNDLSPLKDLTNLEILYIGDNPINDIAPLAELTNLNYLYIWGEQIRDITPLKNLTNLETLIVGNNQVRDVTRLAELTNLTWLDLSNNQINNITPLAELTNLENLTFNYNGIDDITPLAELKQLTSLWLIGNRIRDITPLAELTNLTKLNLSFNQIRDITPLAELVNLESLWLSDNQIRDISPLVKLKKLTNLSLRKNLIVNRILLQTLLQHNPSLEVDIGLDPSTDPNLSEIEVEGSITGPWLWMIAPTPAHQGGAASTNVDSLAAASGGVVTEADIAENGANEDDTVGNLTWTLAEIHSTSILFDVSDNVTNVVHRIGWAEGDVDHHSSYALITLEAATAQKNVVMRVGSDDSIKVWLNGEVVHNNPVNRESSSFQDFFRVNLKQGDNLLLVKVSEATGNWSMFVGIDAEVTAVYKPPVSVEPVVPAWDVNQDGQVNLLDLALVAQYFGETDFENTRVDVNGDGTVNILDLALVAKHFGV